MSSHFKFLTGKMKREKKLSGDAVKKKGLSSSAEGGRKQRCCKKAKMRKTKGDKPGGGLGRKERVETKKQYRQDNGPAESDQRLVTGGRCRRNKEVDMKKFWITRGWTGHPQYIVGGEGGARKEAQWQTRKKHKPTLFREKRKTGVARNTQKNLRKGKGGGKVELNGSKLKDRGTFPTGGGGGGGGATFFW